MDKLRTMLRTHLGKGPLLTITLFTLVALGFVGKSLTLVTASSAEESAFARMAIPHELPQHRASTTLPMTHMVVSDRSFAPGENSPEVQNFQHFLIAKGFLASTTDANGHYGDETLKAAKKYQTSKNIPPLGIIGPETREAWKKDLSK